MQNLATRLTSIERRLATRTIEPRLIYEDPVTFARQKLGFKPDAWQAHVLESQHTRLLMNICRQAGKSTVSAILALHRALYVPRSLILLVSPSLRQSSELFRKGQDFLFALPVRPVLTEENRLSLQLRNGSRIVSLPAKEATVRGFSSVSLVIEDEAARVSDDLHMTIRPMLAVSRGRHILMSTPFGKRGHFYDAWEHGGADWERVKITAGECPRIPRDFLAEEKRSMPALWFDSEYRCEFVDTPDVVFSQEDIMRALDADVPAFQPLPAPWEQNRNGARL
jgi:hypothetical protein